MLEPSGVELAARAVHAEIEDGADPLLAEFRRRGIDRIGENEQTSAVDLDDDVPGLGELERQGVVGLCGHDARRVGTDVDLADGARRTD